MKKNKKNNSSKKTLLGGAAKSLRKLGKGNALGKLSTTQKVVGGAALVALGLGYLSTRRKASAADTTADATAAEQNLAALDANA